MNCTCKDWKPNIDKINAPITLLTLRFGGQYQFDGVPFHYCPWCGKELQDERESEKQNPSRQPRRECGVGLDGEEEHVANLHNEWTCRGRNPVSEYACRSEFVRDLERRLRHAWKLVNSLRIDAMNGELDCKYIKQRLADIEEVLQ